MSNISDPSTNVSAPADIYDTETFEPGRCVGPLINRVRLALLDSLDRALSPLNVTSAQYVTLSILASGADSASQICKGISYDAGAMTRMIDRLEQRGLLKRVRVADDRRTVKLQLTDEGKALYPKMRASAMEVINGLLRGFTKAEARQLEDFLKRMLENA
jgi:MarR family transcriptional regulator, multiple antibiotic resistance protein MarR